MWKLILAKTANILKIFFRILVPAKTNSLKVLRDDKTKLSRYYLFDTFFSLKKQTKKRTNRRQMGESQE